MLLKTKLKLAAMSVAICMGSASVGIAEQAAAPAKAQVTKAKLLEDVGGTDRINYSGKLRMLSQRIPAAACNLHAGVDPEGAKKILAGATAEFEKILKGLEFGDPDLNIIGQESRRKTLAALEVLKERWVPVDAAAKHILDEGTTDALIQELADQNGPLLEAAKVVVSELTGQYSDPAALLQADAIRIDIAGRQRMLSQRISKDLCMMLSGVNVEASRASLEKAVGMFDVSLLALTDGMPAAGIQASTNPEIIAGLEVVVGHWSKIHPDLDVMIAGGTMDAEHRALDFHELNLLLVDMNKVVQMYAKFSKQEI